MKRAVVNFFRVAVCVAALWIVIRGITYHDHVLLRGGGDLAGTVRNAGDPVIVLMRDGAMRSVPMDTVAIAEDGAPRITYGLRSALANSNKYLLLLAFLIHFPVVWPQALRFQWMLAAQGIRLRFLECLKLSFAGNFLNFATPLGSNAGDVFKAYFTALHTRHKTEAVTTVVLDRMIGLGSLLLIVTVITALSPIGSRLAAFKPYMLTAFGLGLAVTIAYLSPWLRRVLLPKSLVAKLPLFEHIERVDRAARTLAGCKGTVIAAVLMTIFLQAVAMTAYLIVAAALGLAVHLGNSVELSAYFYTGVVVQSLPGPPQGLGTVELAYRYFFASVGSPSQIVCMALAIRIIVFVCALPGLLVTLTGSYRPGDVTELDAALKRSDVASTNSERAEIVGA